MRSLRDLAETYGVSGLALICALVAVLGWFVTLLAWAGVEAMNGQVEPRMPPAYLVPLGTAVFTGVAVLAGVTRLRRGR